MQPKTDLLIDEQAFNVLKEKLKATRLSAKMRRDDPTWSMDIPYEVGLKLTNRCDLRCKHCFQWNDKGHHKNMDSKDLSKNGDLSVENLRKVFAETNGHRNMLYLWGGEPLVYEHWDELIELMVQNPTETVMCTNGIAIKKRVDSLLRVSEKLTILFSIEGLEEEHDNLRGKNSFKKTIENMKLLLDLQKEGKYKGKISAATVVSNEMVPNLVKFCEFMNETGINTLHINFPWYIPEHVACEVDQYFVDNFSWMGTDKKEKNTWHSFDYHIDEHLIESIIEQMHEIKSRKWNIRIRFRPQLTDDEIRNFIKGLPIPYEDKQTCLGISSRVDIMPDGSVAPCKKFPEFVVGDINKTSLLEAWKGEGYEKFRHISNNCLNPLCLKCEILEMAGA